MPSFPENRTPAEGWSMFTTVVTDGREEREARVHVTGRCVIAACQRREFEEELRSLVERYTF